MSNYVAYPNPPIVLSEDFEKVQQALKDDARNQQYKKKIEGLRQKKFVKDAIKAIHWKNRVPDTQLTLCQIVPWVADGPDFTCVHCKHPTSKAYDVVLEWGDTGSYETIDWTCDRCVKKLVPVLVHDGEADVQKIREYIDKCTKTYRLLESDE